MNIKRIYIGYLLHVLVAIFFFMIGIANGQEFITTENIEDKIDNGLMTYKVTGRDDISKLLKK